MVRRFCKEDGKDFSDAHDAGFRLLQNNLLKLMARENLFSYKLPEACLESLDLLMEAALAAFRCACPAGGRAPVVPPPADKVVSEDQLALQRAERWKHLGHLEGLGEDGRLRNAIATLPEERPTHVEDLLQLASYPKYENGPLAFMPAEENRDVRFIRGGSRDGGPPVGKSLNDWFYNSKQNPKRLRVFRFAWGSWEYPRRGVNGNAGDLSHVCHWGSACCNDGPDSGPEYALFVYTVSVPDGSRGPYAKCNNEDCRGAETFGWRYKDLNKPGYCYQGSVNWYAMPEAGRASGNWKVESVDRVLSWQCARQLGILKLAKQEQAVFQAIDKVLFTVDGCHQCPDLYEPDDTPRRVCPRK